MVNCDICGCYIFHFYNIAAVYLPYNMFLQLEYVLIWLEALNVAMINNDLQVLLDLSAIDADAIRHRHI